MPLDPFLAAKLHLLAGVPSDHLQQRWEEFARDPRPWSAPRSVSVHALDVPGPHGAVPCRVYAPAQPTGTVLVWVHGGGFSAGDLDMPEAHVVSSELAARAGAHVLSVDYHLAGDNVQYPVPIEDVQAAWRAVTTGQIDGLDASPRVVLGGASAGAALALAAAIRTRESGETQPTRLVLVYPFAHFPNPAPDAALSTMLSKLPAALRFSPASIEAMVRGYVGRITDLPPDALPGGAPLRGLPPVHLVLSEYDDLRASGELLERQLVAEGVPVEVYMARGMLHGHLNRTPSLAEVDRSLAFLATALTDDGLDVRHPTRPRDSPNASQSATRS